MANIHVDSELMLHMMPAQPITTARRFTAVHDESHNPLLFSISSDGHFLAIKSDGCGRNVIIDLSNILNIRDTAHAFAVSQSTDNSGMIFVAFATENGPYTSNLHVFSPLRPNDLDLPGTELRKKLLISSGQTQKARITQLHMNRSTNGSYPLLVSVYTDPNGDVNISRVAVAATSWKWTTDLHIPELAKGFIGMCAGTLSIGDGIFVLYTVLGKPSLMFSTTDPGDKITVDLKLPSSSNPGSLSTFYDDDGYSNVLIAGGGLYYLNADDCTQSGAVAKQISNNALYSQVENIFVAQAGDAISAWFETKEHALGYQRVRNDGTLEGDAVPLLPSGSNAEFAPLIDMKSKSQLLIILDDDLRLSILEQSVDTRIWNKTPFLIHQVQKMTEISAFVSHIQINDERGWPLGLTSFILSSSAWVTVLINGTQHSIGTTGIAVETDASGVITLIVPCQDLSCYEFTLRNVSGSSHLPVSGYVINPAQKVQDRLATIKTGDDLRNAKTSDGTPFLHGSDASDADIDNAAKAIASMHSISADRMLAVTTSRTVARSGSISRGDGVKHVAWEWWEWVKRQATKVTNWIVEKVSGAWHFIVHLAGEAWSFILDSANAVAKAVTFVLEKIKVAFKNVINFFGFLFNWDDIKNTRDSIKIMFNAGLDYGSNFLSNNKSVVGKLFDGLEAQLLKSRDAPIPKDIKERQEGPETSSTSKDSATRSAPANIGSYHFSQAKSAEPAVIGVTDSLVTLYHDIIEPVLQGVSEAVQKIAKTLSQTFDKDKSISMTQIFQQLGEDVLRTFLSILKKLVTGLMDVGKDLIEGIKGILNANVDIPVLTPLLKSLGVPDFSLLDVISIVLAIPVTVVAKAITGSAPKRIQTFDYRSMVEGGQLDKQSLLAYNDLASYLDISYTMLHTIYKVYKIFTAEAPEPETFSYLSFILDIVVQIGTFPYDTESPGRGVRIATWGILTTNVVIRAVCLKAKVPSAKILAMADILIAVVTFALTQVVHGLQFIEDYPEKDEAVTGLSIGSSIFTVIGGVAGGYGALVPEPLEKAVAAIIVAGGQACVSVVKTGKCAIAIKKKYHNYIVEGV
ncbi:hypothetical protein AcV5_010466 [Taiwanofungus camphoratus]|nr:hypothetical protein AcV5_010466 [Antrodia cinnamomea]